MSNQIYQLDSHKPQPIDIWQKFKSKKFIFITLGALLGIVILFLAIVTFIPEKYLEDEITPTPPPTTPTLRAPRVEDQVIIKFKKGVTDKQINEKLKQYNATIINKIDRFNLIVVKVPKGQGDAVLDAFKKDNLIEEAEPNYIYKATWAPNDTYYAGIYFDSYQKPYLSKINIEPAWDVTKGDGVKIAILDSGIDLNHPDLASKIVAQQDFTGEGIDHSNGHGTYVAGIAAAVTDNATGIAGTCPQCQLIIGKVINNNGRAAFSSIASGIDWALSEGAKVINMSFSGPDSSSLMQEAVNYAWANGAVLVVAAGNDGNEALMYPAAYPNVVSVAATDKNDNKADFSSYGTWVSVAAPGVNIYSTLPGGAYDYASGTSASVPIVSGVVGLIWASSFGTSNAAVVQRLCDTADKITGTGTYWECGRINAGSAVVALGRGELNLGQNDNSVQDKAVTSDTIISGQVYELVNQCSGKVMDVEGVSTSDGANVFQWTWNGGENQQWKIERLNEDPRYYKLTAQHSGKVLEVNGASTEDGANVDQWPWVEGAPNEQWSIKDVGDGFYTLYARHSDKALDVSGSSTDDGANIQQWTSNNTCAQKWQIISL